MTCFLHHASEHGHTCTETELVVQFRGGECRAFDELHRRHGPALRAYVAGLLRGRGDVEDVVQDAFMRAVVLLRDENRDVTELRPWLFRVAYNRSIDLVRATRPAAELDDTTGAVHDVHSAVRIGDELRLTMVALRALPSAQRRALVLNSVHGESYADVAKRLQVTPQAAKSLAYRGREQARRTMAGARSHNGVTT